MRVLLQAFALAGLLDGPTRSPAAAPRPDAESDAFTAAYAQKSAGKSVEAAAAFEAIAKTFPSSTRVGEALVEAGVGWFADGRGKLVLHRSNAGSSASFAKALDLFKAVAEERPADPSAGRAQYMRGSTHQFAGDLAAAEEDYSKVLEKFAGDRKYYGKSLERRAAVRRQLLMTDLALEDLRRYQKELPQGDVIEAVNRYVQFAGMIGKPAPQFDVETWLQGGTTTLDAMRGNVVALYFFASWCGNCAKELPFVLDLNRRYEAAGLRLVGVFDHSEKQTVDSVRKFLASNGIPFPALMDRGQTTASYLGRKIPDFVLIDKRGRVRWHDHPENLADWTLEALLGEESAPASPTKPR